MLWSDVFRLSALELAAELFDCSTEPVSAPPPHLQLRLSLSTRVGALTLTCAPGCETADELASCPTLFAASLGLVRRLRLGHRRRWVEWWSGIGRCRPHSAGQGEHKTRAQHAYTAFHSVSFVFELCAPG
jgi:hypothetical protein